MKVMMSLCLALIIFVFTSEATRATASQQDQNSQTTQSSQSSQNSQTPKGNQNMGGKVNSDARKFTNDRDSKSYNVSNPDALKDYENQDVAVLVHVDPDTGTIHIIQVEPTQSMSGKVSSDGRTFVNDSDSKRYSVDNPGALKGHEDQHVAIVVYVDPDNGELHITQVAPPQ